MGSFEFLKNLRRFYPNGKIPKTVVPVEMFMDRGVFTEVDRLCVQNDLELDLNVQMFEEAPPEIQHFIYRCTYKVGVHEACAESYIVDHARIIAAGKLFQMVTGRIFPKIEYYVGRRLRGKDDYDYTEADVYYLMLSESEEAWVKKEEEDRGRVYVQK